MLKIDMVPFFQINRLCSPCYKAFVTPKRIDAIDAIEQNAGSTLQVPHISKYSAETSSSRGTTRE